MGAEASKCWPKQEALSGFKPDDTLIADFCNRLGVSTTAMQSTFPALEMLLTAKTGRRLRKVLDLSILVETEELAHTMSNRDGGAEIL